MTAEYDPLYLGARGVLLDALEALGPQCGAIIVVGAQAIYLRTGDDVAGVAPYTTDADLALAPTDLAAEPLIEAVLKAADFRQEGKPGEWLKTVEVAGRPVDVPVDIMVPSGLAPAGGRRSVRIPPHDKMVARKAVGLEGTVLDHDLMRVAALHPEDTRAFTVRVAGPAALLVAKIHKLRDRLVEGKTDRIADKDAADVYRLMLGVPVRELAERMHPLLRDPVAGVPSTDAMDALPRLFGARASVGVQMATQSLRVGVPAERVADVCTGFVRSFADALSALHPRRSGAEAEDR